MRNCSSVLTNNTNWQLNVCGRRQCSSSSLRNRFDYSAVGIQFPYSRFSCFLFRWPEKSLPYFFFVVHSVADFGLLLFSCGNNFSSANLLLKRFLLR